MADKYYKYGNLKWFKGELLWLASGGSDIRMLLLNASATFNDAHQYVADLTPATYELTGTGYARKTLTLIDAALSSSTVQCKAVNPSYTNIDAGTIGAGVVYKYNSSDADHELLVFLDPTNLVTNGGTVTWQFGGTATNGIVFASASS